MMNGWLVNGWRSQAEYIQWPYDMAKPTSLLLMSQTQQSLDSRYSHNTHKNTQPQDAISYCMFYSKQQCGRLADPKEKRLSNGGSTASDMSNEKTTKKK